MKLFEHQDFEQAILGAADHFRGRGLRPSFIEKDYYVTEALRAVASVAGNAVIFKGGTSLSKGWGLIERFSEDIDLFLDPDAFTSRLGTNAINRELKKLRDAVLKALPLQYLKDESKTFGGLGRNDRFSYRQLFGGQGEIAGGLFLESGIASGREPTEVVRIRSFLSQFLEETGMSLGAQDEASFQMRLLHFRRTFVEKMFAIHKKVELHKREEVAVGPHTRHYYDLFQLSDKNEVVGMLRSDEYAQIKADYDRISRTYFPEHYFFPAGMSFANSEALFPDAELSKTLGQQYEAQCALLCHGSYPRWNDVLARFEAMRTLL